MSANLILLIFRFFDNTRILGTILNAISYFRICKCHKKMQCYLKYEKVSFLVK